MRWKKSPPELIARFGALLPKHPDVEPRQMFGYPCAFLRGNFWVGLHEDRVVVRLPDGLHARVEAVKDAPPFDPMGGRPMKGWFVVPPAVVKDDAALARLFAQSLPLVASLPPKAAGRVQKSSAKKASAQRSSAKKASAKKASPKKASPKKASPKKASSRKASPRKASPKSTSVRGARAGR